MIIDQLPSLATPLTTDEMPLERGTTAYKATIGKIAPVRSVNGQTGDVNIVIDTGINYFYQVVVSAANNAEIFRITDASIDTNTIVLDCTFADPSYITSDVDWTSYEGYIAFTGTCSAATTANVALGNTDNL